MTTQGTVGILFDITEDDVTTATGDVTQEHAVPDAIASLSIATTDIVYSISGSVGTTAFDLNLNSLNNASGTGYSYTIIRNNEGDFTTVKSIVIYNSHASNTLVIGSPASTSLFTWSSTSATLSIDANTAMQWAFATAKTIGSNGKLNIVGSGASTTFLIYLLGT